MVVREHVHNKRLVAWHYVKGGALALGLVLAGYSAHAWQAWGATSAIQRCRDSVVWNAAGQGFCAEARIFADPPLPPGRVPASP